MIPASAPASVTATTLWRRLRGILLVGLLVLAAAAVPTLLSPPRIGGRYADPADPSLNGGKALAEVLADHGVTVQRVDNPAAALAADGPDALLLLTEASPVPREQARRLVAARADRLILGPVPHLDLLASGVTPKNRAAGVRSRRPECGLPEAVRAGTAYLGGMSLSGPPGSIGCYPAAGRPTLVRYPVDGRTVTVLGDGSFITNLRLAEDGNAALAMNLAGSKPRLIWLVAPDRPEAATGEARSIGELIPDAVDWAVVQLVIAVAVTALWRGRRLGPVVAERLPVVVRASETVEGRGRLYRARRARDRAALALRAAAADRMATRLGLPRAATPKQIATAVAARTRQDPERVRDALDGAAPRDDRALVALAGYLDTLERQVGES